MLREFKGIIDTDGLCSFAQPATVAPGESSSASSTRLPFWAVVEEKAATKILRELMLGSRKRALMLLEESAVSLGSLPAR